MEKDKESAVSFDSPNIAVAFALFRGVFGDRIPKGHLTSDVVPPALLEVPTEIATDELVRHAKKCRNIHCPDWPPSLQRFRRMRPDALRKAKNEVYNMLWTDCDHLLVAFVRKEILRRYSDLNEQIASGVLFSENRLEETLLRLAPNGPRVIASVIWASKFKPPDADLLFRCLIGFYQKTPEQTHRRMDDGNPGVSTKEVRKVKRDLRHAREKEDQLVRDLRGKDRALDKLKKEFNRLDADYTVICNNYDAVEQQIQGAETARDTAKERHDIVIKRMLALNRDLRSVQKARNTLERERSDLAREFAAERRLTERLRMEFEQQPKGSEAVRDFLRSEEKRIKTDKLITFGGTKERAEAEWTVHKKLERAFLEAYPQYRQPPPPVLRARKRLRFTALGGSAEVGRSSYLMELGGHRIMVDCGIKPSSSEDLHPNLDKVRSIDALLLTHAHTDHIGWVPALIRRIGEMDIYCSAGTAALLPIMLEDCRRHYVRKTAQLRDRARYSSSSSTVEEAYDQDDVDLVARLAITCPFNEDTTLPFGEVTVRAMPAGHILGASSLLVEDLSGRRVMFSGDFSSFPQMTLEAAAWPEDIGEIDLLVLESTYGGSTHSSADESRNEFISFIRETVQNGGSVIVPSFALGRAQELLTLIYNAQTKGDLTSDVLVHVDGMIRRINPIYRKLGKFAVPENAFNDVSGEAERDEIIFAAHTKPSIIVTTSGMMNGGPVIEYARRLLPDARNRIILTGYQDEGAPSKALFDLASGGRNARIVRIPDESGDIVEFKAALPAKHVQISAHADQPGLLEYAARVQPKHIVLVHGEPKAQEALQFQLQQMHPRAEIACGPSETLEIE